jgi:putative transposase
MFLDRGITFTHEAVRKWEAKLAPVLSETLRQHRRRKVGQSWYVDETYLRVKGQWVYLYRAIDRDGNLVDVLLSKKRDRAAAEAFFRSARTVTDLVPARVTTDGHGAYPLGSGQVLLKPPAQIPAQPEGREAQEATGIRDSPIVG